MVLETIRLSQQGKEHLIRLKRLTGIEHWNILCRWAFCISLAESNKPTISKIPSDSNVEMSWKVFGGKYADIYSAILKQRCIKDGVEINEESLATYFRVHLHRGLSYLAANKKLRKIDHLVELAL